jgi:hypothetical protein
LQGNSIGDEGVRALMSGLSSTKGNLYNSSYQLQLSKKKKEKKI